LSAMRLETRADATTLARAAARFVAERARRAMTERGRFIAAFSGGSTPLEMLEALVAEDLPWCAMHVFQVDERAAPRGDPARNLTLLENALLGRTPLSAERLHAMPVEESDLDAAARRYAQLLLETAGTPPVLDLVHLGLGDDGHTASLVRDDSALEVTDRDVAISGEYRGQRRMTLTLPSIDRARQRLWLVTGADKAGMLARLMAGDRSIPAGRVRGEDSVVFADAAAAGGETHVEHRL
jgi:6-phosphogluconolactonase